MKKVLILLLFIVSIGVIVYGNLHWNSMVTSSGSEEGSVANRDSNDAPDVAAGGNYLKYAGNWPEGARTLYEEKLQDGESFKIVLMGSQAMDSVENGWDDIVTEKLQEVYEDSVEVSSISYDVNTLEFVNEEKYLEIAELEPNLVIFEPLTLNDNGEVVIEDSLVNIETIMDEIKEESGDVYFALTPPQPVYKPNLYAFQIEETRDFTSETDLPYIDHWENWPAVEEEEIKDYLDEDSSPNEEGHKAWATGINNYLVSE
ncbi:SGNH/GDSL hydrolase family protein [Rossellomorea arthrocnemi]